MKARKFRMIERIPAQADFGRVDLVHEHEITPHPEGGIVVEGTLKGTIEGEPVNNRWRKWYPEGTMEAAVTYRGRNGFVEV